jgi:lipoprotein-anchoring transpeptidase ErfK/SrfK
LIAGVIALTGSAAAAPLPLFPFSSPGQPQAVQPAPSDESNAPFELPARFKRQTVNYPTREAAGTIIVDTPNTYLYYVLGGGQAIRYGIGVGRDGFGWAGKVRVGRMAEWPTWTPPAEMVARDANAAKWAAGMPGGPDNPLGPRAMYLYEGDNDTIYRIHGTVEPWTIGLDVSSGCIRLNNDDVVDLYSQVKVGAKVIVLMQGAALYKGI